MALGTWKLTWPLYGSHPGTAGPQGHPQHRVSGCHSAWERSTSPQGDYFWPREPLIWAQTPSSQSMVTSLLHVAVCTEMLFLHTRFGFLLTSSRVQATTGRVLGPQRAALARLPDHSPSALSPPLPGLGQPLKAAPIFALTSKAEKGICTFHLVTAAGCQRAPYSFPGP